MAMTRVSKAQMDLVRAIGAGRSLRGFDGRTRDAVESKGLAVRVDTGTGWELTSDGRLLLGEITDKPAAGPAMPADPFAVFDQFDTDGL